MATGKTSAAFLVLLAAIFTFGAVSAPAMGWKWPKQKPNKEVSRAENSSASTAFGSEQGQSGPAKGTKSTEKKAAQGQAESGKTSKEPGGDQASGPDR